MAPSLRKSSAFVFAAAAVVAVCYARAQSHPLTTETQDTAAIQAIVADEQDAWNRGDAKAFSAHYAQDGSFTNIVGMQLYGRPGFEKQHEVIFTTIYKGSRNVLTIGKLRFLRPDVAVVDVDSSLSGATRYPPGIQPGADGALHTKLQMVLTKGDNIWQISAFHNVAVIPLPTHP